MSRKNYKPIGDYIRKVEERNTEDKKDNIQYGGLDTDGCPESDGGRCYLNSRTEISSIHNARVTRKLDHSL